MTDRPNNPFDEGPAAWALWQWVVARIPAEEVGEFAEVMRGYRDEVRADSASTEASAPSS